MEEQAREEGNRLSSFRVHAQYGDIRKEADKLTEKIHALANANYQNGQLASAYEENRSRGCPDETEVEKLYQEAGVVLDGSVRKRLADVKEFHRTVVMNRKDFLHLSLND